MEKIKYFLCCKSSVNNIISVVREKQADSVVPDVATILRRPDTLAADIVLIVTRTTTQSTSLISIPQILI